MPFWCGWTLFAVIAGWGAMFHRSPFWFCFAAASLAAAAATHLAATTGGLPFNRLWHRVHTKAWWLCLSGLWLAFWLMDLHAARFQFVLLAAPVMSLVVAAGLRRFSLSTLGLGAMLGMALVWVALTWRADNGCTGVSDIYEATLVGTAIALFGFGPSTFARLLPSRAVDRRPSTVDDPRQRRYLQKPTESPML
jgi:hypothetical protein